MKTIKADNTIIITGIFKKRYWLVIPDIGVFELETISWREQLKRNKAKSNG